MEILRHLSLSRIDDGEALLTSAPLRGEISINDDGNIVFSGLREDNGDGFGIVFPDESIYEKVNSAFIGWAKNLEGREVLICYKKRQDYIVIEASIPGKSGKHLGPVNCYYIPLAN